MRFLFSDDSIIEPSVLSGPFVRDRGPENFELDNVAPSPPDNFFIGEIQVCPSNSSKFGKRKCLVGSVL